METLDSGTLLLLGGLFVATFAGVVARMWWKTPKDMQRRIQQAGGVSLSRQTQSSAGSGWAEKIEKISQPISQLSITKDGWEDSPLRLRLMNAGWRSSTAAGLYFAAKTVLAVLLPLGGRGAGRRAPGRN